MKHANEKAIGVFVLAAMALTVVAIVYFGSTNLFSIKRTFVLYFSNSVNGLEVGADVKFKGVKIGEVKKIILEINAKSKIISMPVIVEIDSANLKIEDAKSIHGFEIMDALIKRGLRAKLASQSMVTGQLYIELDFHPDTLIAYKHNVTNYKQIPTIASSSEAITNGVQAATGAFIEAKKFMVNVDNKINPISTSVQETLAQFQDTLTSIRVLADYLSRHPESLISGKGRDN